MGDLSILFYIAASFPGMTFLTLLIIYLVGGCYKMTGKVKGKVTDAYRHDASTDLDRKGIDGDRGTYYNGHIVYEVDGTKYRKFGTIGAVSAMTRKVTVWYDPKDPQKASWGKGATVTIMVISALLTIFLLVFPTVYPLISGA